MSAIAGIGRMPGSQGRPVHVGLRNPAPEGDLTPRCQDLAATWVLGDGLVSLAYEFVQQL